MSRGLSEAQATPPEFPQNPLLALFVEDGPTAPATPPATSKASNHYPGDFVDYQRLTSQTDNYLG